MKQPQQKKKKNGRPTKLTPEITEKIATAVRAGNYIETAAGTAGISKDTLYRWLKEGARTKARESDVARFSDAIQKALADAEASGVAAITQAGMPRKDKNGKIVAQGSWQAIAWRLERMHPEKYGMRQRVDHAGVPNRPIEIAGRVGVYLPAEVSDDEYVKGRREPASKKGTKR
jgi:transposase